MSAHAQERRDSGHQSSSHLRHNRTSTPPFRRVQSGSQQEIPDTGTPIDDRDHKVPFPFTGKIEKLTISVEPPRLTPEDERRLLQRERKVSAN
jgi:hypothetical protein